ncbi:DoxX-like family protein [Paenibacillus luteus]|uniref:DoxX-like family protein n=1 Tax=Paenibacillus luteus TaxID=2545753 RepID=UPI0011430600|nr:DoxX-like family protein [Paenibacillus luteus]
MNNKPIYVELEIKGSMSELWEHTQNPLLHEQWDLRFTQIRYLPKSHSASIQKFLYETRIGFGIKISGTGESFQTNTASACYRKSSLTFASEQPISLIRRGGGYWKYEAHAHQITFSTLYSYQTRFGLAGSLLDRFVFQPLFGYATAWSFDRLRIWLEERIPPAVIAERAIVHYLSVMLLMLMWCYEGLVPKLLFPEAGELAVMQHIGWFDGIEKTVIGLLGAAEIGLGLLTVGFHRRRWIFTLQMFLLLALTLPIAIAEPELFKSPFNPLTLALPMVGLCCTAMVSRLHLPQASRCKRAYHKSAKESGMS